MAQSYKSDHRFPGFVDGKAGYIDKLAGVYLPGNEIGFVNTAGKIVIRKNLVRQMTSTGDLRKSAKAMISMQNAATSIHPGK